MHMTVRRAANNEHVVEIKSCRQRPLLLVLLLLPVLLALSLLPLPDAAPLIIPRPCCTNCRTQPSSNRLPAPFMKGSATATCQCCTRGAADILNRSR
jgi:hypothetical protein